MKPREARPSTSWVTYLRLLHQDMRTLEATVEFTLEQVALIEQIALLRRKSDSSVIYQAHS